MPVACSTTALSGSDGLITFKPAGTDACLLDFTDFPAGTSITVPADTDFRIGDPVVFEEEGTASIDSGLTAGTTYYVVATAAGTIDVSATLGGTAVTLLGDGGTGTADTPGAENHISIGYAEFEAICQVTEWNIDVTREQIDTTTLPCSVSGGAAKYAQFRTQTSGYASGEGSMTVLFTYDQTSLANRLMANSLLKDSSAYTKLYVSAASDGAGGVDDSGSMYFEGKITLLGFSVSQSPDDPTSGEVSFSLADQPVNVFGIALN